ncbi:MAG: hypothetical protein NWE93_11290 [Candidatus Bathyarchaeota archaeon]|nr:hypothetical protein [Candidatus Bathyarchaeota archaeon]
MAKYTEADINRILNLKGWIGATIDVFNLYGVLTIGVSSDPGQWEIAQRTYSENKLPISLKDFETCQTEDDVRAAFNRAIKHAVASMMFRGEEAYTL